ncbi:MAG TPA: DUF1236 domain-containing protein [Xanthobacteraceae bacterium]|jgi:hypothetical protein
MHKTQTLACALVLAVIGTSAAAQTPPPPATAPQQQERVPTSPVPPVSKLNLTLEQRYTIREIVKDKQAPTAPAGAKIAAGEPVPPGVTPQPMPSEIARKVPQIKAHRYFVTSQQIVIVDPKANKITEVIKLAGD